MDVIEPTVEPTVEPIVEPIVEPTVIEPTVIESTYSSEEHLTYISAQLDNITLSLTWIVGIGGLIVGILVILMFWKGWSSTK